MPKIRHSGHENHPSVSQPGQSDEIARSELARRAEELMDSVDNVTAGEPETLQPDAARAMLHELRVHQIELEMQNEELRQTQSKLDASQARYFDLYDLAPVGYLTLDGQGLILEANLKAANMLGTTRSALVRKRLSHYVYSADQDIYYLRRKVLLSTRTAQEYELRLVRADDSSFWARIESSATPEHTADESRQRVIISDISATKQTEDELTASFRYLQEMLTELRAAQTQLVRQERLAAIGQLAAGIAHDFNNILTIIMLHAQLALQNPALPPSLSKRIETIMQQAAQATGLIQQLLDFGRRSTLQLGAQDLALLLHEQIALLQRMIPEHIDIVFTCEVEPCMVNADSDRIKQMFTNLALNARDAMPDGGRLDFVLKERQVSSAGSAPFPGMQAGPWIEILVQDTGTGIPPDVLPHLFEPFFSTKVSGAGTGLGLPQVFGIVRQHSGFIGVESGEGKGTTFTVYLPALPPEAVAQPVAAVDTVDWGHTQTILVVEDNAVLREALVDILEQLDYRTVAAANGQEALVVLAQQGAEIDLILSDMVMPGMGGDALFHAVQERGLPPPMIILSGHPLEAKLQALKADGLAGWLLKPPSIQALVAMVESTLAGTSGSTAG